MTSDKDIFIEYKESNVLLEQYRIKRLEEGKRNRSFIFKLFRIRKRKCLELHKKQWHITNQLYIQTDEYKKTRGY